MSLQRERRRRQAAEEGLMWENGALMGGDATSDQELCVSQAVDRVRVSATASMVNT